MKVDKNTYSSVRYVSRVLQTLYLGSLYRRYSSQQNTTPVTPAAIYLALMSTYRPDAMTLSKNGRKKHSNRTGNMLGRRGKGRGNDGQLTKRRTKRKKQK